MKDLNEIQNDLEKNKDAIAKIETRIADAAAAVEEAKTAYAAALLKELPPDELAPLRESLAHKQADFDGLKGVKQLLVDEREALEGEKELILLHDKEVRLYHENRTAYNDAVDRLEKEGSELNTLVGRVSDIINVMFQSLEKSTSSLSWTAEKLPEKYSLESYLAGELAPAEAEDRDAILEATGNDLKGRVGQFDVENVPLKNLEELLDRFEGWRRRVINIRSGIALVKNKHVLAPPPKRRVNIDSATARAEMQLQSKAAA